MRDVTRILLRRAEGPTEECTDWIEFDGFATANERLRAWAHTAPANGGYDKCDFKVEYDGSNEDGYEGRFDLEREHETGGDLLQEHIRDFVNWYWGVRPAREAA